MATHHHKSSSSLPYRYLKYDVSCRVVVQLVNLDPWYDWGGPDKVGACKAFVCDQTGDRVRMTKVAIFAVQDYK